MKGNYIARSGDYSLEINLSSFHRTAERNDFPRLGSSPLRQSKLRKRDAGTVRKFEHEQMVADENRSLHGSGRNHPQVENEREGENEEGGDPEKRLAKTRSFSELCFRTGTG